MSVLDSSNEKQTQKFVLAEKFDLTCTGLGNLVTLQSEGTITIQPQDEELALITMSGKLLLRTSPSNLRPLERFYGQKVTLEASPGLDFTGGGTNILRILQGSEVKPVKTLEGYMELEIIGQITITGSDTDIKKISENIKVK